MKHLVHCQSKSGGNRYPAWLEKCCSPSCHSHIPAAQPHSSSLPLPYWSLTGPASLPRWMLKQPKLYFFLSKKRGTYCLSLKMECAKLGSLISRQIWQVNKEKTEFPPSFPICPPCPICWSLKPSLSPQVTMGSFGLLSHSQERSCHEKWLHRAFWCASHQRLLCSLLR